MPIQTAPPSQAANHSHGESDPLPLQRRNETDSLPEDELDAMATESSQAERRADDAERELIEWKKIRFMQDRVGEDFTGIILSCTKYGFFVELDELFIEGLVPIANLQDDRYFFRDTDRTIVGAATGAS